MASNIDTSCEPKYVELSSSYRNRTIDPLTTDFTVTTGFVRSAPEGTNPASIYVDPVSDQAPILSWEGNVLRTVESTGASSIASSIALTIIQFATASLGGTNTNSSFVAIATAAGGPISYELQNIEGYYNGLVIQWSDGGAPPVYERKRVISYTPQSMVDDPLNAGTYVQSGLFVVDGSFSTGFNNLPIAAIVTIQDPTFFSGDTSVDQKPVVFVPQGVDMYDAYTDYLLHNEVLNQYRPVLRYDPLTHELTLDTSSTTGSTDFAGWTVGWLPSHTYSLRKVVATVPYLVSTAGSISTIQFPVGSSSVTGFYNGYWVRKPQDTASGANNEIRRIVSYDGPTRTATFSQPFTRAWTAADNFELLTQIRDNSVPLSTSLNRAHGSSLRRYAIQLIALNLPNQVVTVGNGGVLNRYPYVILTIVNINSSSAGSSNIISSNNPNVAQARFICAIDDIRNLTQTSFLNIDADGMVNIGMFDMLAGYRVIVSLPNGQTIRFKDYPYAETVAPYAPTQELQVSVVLCFKPV